MGDVVDHYATLRVKPDASGDDIRAAYRRLARQHHPDAKGGSADSMVALNAAWEILGHPVRRAAYDRRRTAGATRLAPPNTPGPIARRARMAAQRRPAVVLDFGRYAGWSILDIARSDPGYLEWFARTPVGRQLRLDIAEGLDLARGVEVA